MDDTRYDDLAAYLVAMKRRRPDVHPYKEDDWDWMDEGLDYLDDGQFDMAEMRFEELTLSQPNFSDGYEGLARLNMAVGRKKEAMFLVDEALRLAKEYLDRGDLPSSVCEAIAELRAQIVAMPDEGEADGSA